MANVCEKCGELFTPANDLCADCDLAETTELYEEITQLRAELEKYKMGKVSPADYYSMAEAEAELCKELAEARAGVEHWKSECNALQRMVHEARAEVAALKRVDAALNEEIKIQRAYVVGRDNTIERKDALIEQMKTDLQRAKDNFETMDKILTTQCAPVNVAKSAYNTGMSYLNDALAAERGE